MRSTREVRNTHHSLHRFRSLMLIAGAMVAATAMPVAAAQEGDEQTAVFGAAPPDHWVYGAEIYLWGAGVAGKTARGDDIDISFSDIIDNLDLAFMGTLAAARDKYTLFGDFIYLNISHDDKTTANIIGNPIKAKVEVKLKTFISTFGGAYSFLQTDSTRLNVLGGARYLGLDGSLKYDIENLAKNKVSNSDDNWDAIIGLRGKTNLNEKWYLNYYADVGTGDSDLTWQAVAAVNYRFRRVDAAFGYRYLDYEFDDSDVIDNLNMGGPFAGIKFRF